MPILNYHNNPFIWTWERPRNAPKDAEPPNKIMWQDRRHDLWFNELQDRKEDIFHINFMLSDAFSVYPLETLMPAEWLALLKQGKITLMLENSGHGYNTNVAGIYRDIVFKYDIDPNNIIFRSESADMLQEVRLISSHFMVPEIKVEWIRQFEFQYSTYTHELQIPNTLENKTYDKKFLSYNGLFRPHRGIVVFLLECYNVLNKGYVSYSVKDNYTIQDTTKHYEWFTQVYEGNQEILDLFEQNKDRLINLVRLDLDDFSQKNTAGHYEEDNWYYEQTYFSLVTETSFPFKPFNRHYPKGTDTGRILSEKIYKPILNKHPFLVASNYQTLALLKSLGYQSFSPYIDESYDEIVDDKLRLVAIAKEVKRLCELSGSEFEEFLVNCKRICEYNFNHLRDMKCHVRRLNY